MATRPGLSLKPRHRDAGLRLSARVDEQNYQRLVRQAQNATPAYRISSGSAYDMSTFGHEVLMTAPRSSATNSAGAYTNEPYAISTCNGLGTQASLGKGHEALREDILSRTSFLGLAINDSLHTAGEISSAARQGLAVAAGGADTMIAGDDFDTGDQIELDVLDPESRDAANFPNTRNEQGGTRYPFTVRAVRPHQHADALRLVIEYSLRQLCGKDKPQDVPAFMNVYGGKQYAEFGSQFWKWAGTVAIALIEACANWNALNQGNQGAQIQPNHMPEMLAHLLIQPNTAGLNANQLHTFTREQTDYVYAALRRLLDPEHAAFGHSYDPLFTFPAHQPNAVQVAARTNAIARQALVSCLRNLREAQKLQQSRVIGTCLRGCKKYAPLDIHLHAAPKAL